MPALRVEPPARRMAALHPHPFMSRAVSPNLMLRRSNRAGQQKGTDTMTAIYISLRNFFTGLTHAAAHGAPRLEQAIRSQKG